MLYEKTAFLITELPTLTDIKKSCDKAFSRKGDSVAVSMTVTKRFERNGNNVMVPVQGDDPVEIKLIVTEHRHFGGNENDLVVRGCATEDVALPNGGTISKGDFIDAVLCIGDSLGELIDVITVNAQSTGDAKYTFDTLADEYVKFGQTEVLKRPYGCR